jgi:hypothetical protein
VPVTIEPEPSEDERRAILAALAGLDEGRTLPPLSAVEETCAVDAENTLLGPPMSPSARSA